MKIDPGTSSVLLVAATQAFQVFSTMMPDRGDVLSASPDDSGMAHDMRHGEIVSTVLTLGFATFMAQLTGNSLPIWIGAASCVTMITAYELTRLRNQS